MMNRAVIPAIMFILFICIISGNASANPVAIDPIGVSIAGFLILFLINLPINSGLYMIFLFMVMKKKKDNRIFTENPEKFLNKVIRVAMAATFAGAIIDSIVIYYLEAAMVTFDLFITIIIGLVMVFITFFFAIIAIQKSLRSVALFISFGVTVVNAAFWYMILYTELIYYFTFVLVVFTIFISYAFLVIVYVFFSYWFEMNHKGLKNKIMNAIMTNRNRFTHFSFKPAPNQPGICAYAPYPGFCPCAPQNGPDTISNLSGLDIPTNQTGSRDLSDVSSAHL